MPDSPDAVGDAETHRVPLDLRGLVPGQQLFRVDGGRRRDPAVEAWLNEEGGGRPLARHWFEQLRRCGEDVLELMHDGCPVAGVGDVPFGYVNTFKQHAAVGSFRGAYLPDAGRLLEGTGKRMRHVKLRAGRLPDAAALQGLIEAAYADVRECLRAGQPPV